MAIEIQKISKEYICCIACGYPMNCDPPVMKPKPGSVYALTVGYGQKSNTMHICKGCLWKLREQMKGILR